MGDNRECDQKPPSDDIEDDSGLELSLGLSCGGFASKAKGKDGSKELNPEQEGNDKAKNGKVNIGDTSMKHFLQGSIGEQDTEVKQLNDSVLQPQQNFWMNLGKNPAKEPENSTETHTNQVQFSDFREAWFAGENSGQVFDRSLNTEKAKVDQHQRQSILNQQHEILLEQQNTRETSDPKWQESRKKRKLVEEQQQQTKDEKDDEKADPHDSETEASSSRIVSPVGKDSVKQCMTTGTDVLEKKEQTPIARTAAVGNESNPELTSTPFMTPVSMTSTGLPYSLQSFPVGPVPYSHSVPVPNNTGVPFPSAFSLPYLMQFMPPTGNGTDRAAVRPMSSSGFQLPLGYAPFQLPTLETPSSWVSVSHSQQPSAYCPRNVGGVRTSSEHLEEESRISQAAIHASQGTIGGVRPCSSEGALQEVQKQESAKSQIKGERQTERSGDVNNSDVGGTSLSSQAIDDDAKRHGIAWPKESVDHFRAMDGLSQEVWNLRPGIASGLKFGGTGNSPDLPWVSTTGPGPNGKTISGVMYKYSRAQVRIVCACHGRHMSPNEFIQHAASADVSNPENNVVGTTFPNGNQTTSAQG